MGKPKSAEDILNEMPSGDDLLATLAQEVGIDLSEPVKEAKKGEPKAGKVKQQAKVDDKPAKSGTKSDSKAKTGTKSKVAEPQPSKKPEKPATKDKPKTKPVQKEKPSTKKDEPVKEAPAKPSKVENAKEQKRDKKAVYAEWRGFKVNYMGKPMNEKGEFLSLPKRYDSKAQEQFRETTGRMVMVIKRDKAGKVVGVHVYAEDKKGKREELKTNGVMVNPNRMENRCRVYAHLLGLAYDRKKDIEEVAV